MLTEYFKNGINLGGFLSQYEIVVDVKDEEKLKKHFELFITAENLDQIASLGFDHVRIPVDGYLFYDMQADKLNTIALSYLDGVLDKCAKRHLNAVIDLHSFYGNEFGRMDRPIKLLLDKDTRSAFVSFWRQMSEHYAGYEKTKLMFELFNEIADSTGYLWNSLCKETAGAIRRADPERWILIGTNCINGVSYLDRICLFDDDKVFYNFHYYEPHVFTHQKAHFSEEFSTWKHTLNYPGSMTDYLAFLEKHPVYAKEHVLINAETTMNDIDLMRANMHYAAEFVRYSGHELYCGEFGVIDTAPEGEAVKWLKDFIQMCDDLRIGHAMWNYKCLDFELVDINNEITRAGIVEYFRNHK